MCKVEDIFNGEVVSLMEMLDARERRSVYQQVLLKRYPNTTLLSATMNVPGPIKSSFELELAFEEIVAMIRAQYPPSPAASAAVAAYRVDRQAGADRGRYQRNRYPPYRPRTN